MKTLFVLLSLIFAEKSFAQTPLTEMSPYAKFTVLRDISFSLGENRYWIMEAGQPGRSASVGKHFYGPHCFLEMVGGDPGVLKKGRTFIIADFQTGSDHIIRPDRSYGGYTSLGDGSLIQFHCPGRNASEITIEEFLEIVKGTLKVDVNAGNEF